MECPGAEPDSGVLAVGWFVRDLTWIEFLHETDLLEVDRESGLSLPCGLGTCFWRRCARGAIAVCLGFCSIPLNERLLSRSVTWCCRSRRRIEDDAVGRRDQPGRASASSSMVVCAPAGLWERG